MCSSDLSFRPFPSDEVRKRLKHGQKIVVVERAFAPGIGGIVSSNIRTALGGIEIEYKGATVPAPSQRRSYK